MRRTMTLAATRLLPEVQVRITKLRSGSCAGSHRVEVHLMGSWHLAGYIERNEPDSLYWVGIGRDDLRLTGVLGGPSPFWTAIHKVAVAAKKRYFQTT